LTSAEACCGVSRKMREANVTVTASEDIRFIFLLQLYLCVPDVWTGLFCKIEAVRSQKSNHTENRFPCHISVSYPSQPPKFSRQPPKLRDHLHYHHMGISEDGVFCMEEVGGYFLVGWTR
jgi:hypothetical protein